MAYGSLAHRAKIQMNPMNTNILIAERAPTFAYQRRYIFKVKRIHDQKYEPKHITAGRLYHLFRVCVPWHFGSFVHL